MPLTRTKVNVQTTENVQVNSEVEKLKKSPDANFATGGLNDETVHAETISLTSSETAKVQADTAKVQASARTAYINQVSQGVQTWNLQPPGLEEFMDLAVAEFCLAKIWLAIVEHRWYAFFTKVVDGVRTADQQKLQDCVNVATRHSYALLSELYGYGNLDVATHLSVKAPVDTVLLCDNSGSMTLTDRSVQGDTEMSRWEALKLAAKDDSFVGAMFDSDGYQLDLMTGDPKLRSICQRIDVNGVQTWVLMDPKTEGKYAILLEERGIPYGFKGLTSQEQVDLIFGTGIGADYGTPTAEAIWRFYETHVRQQARNGTLNKPVIMTIYTDGKPSGRDVEKEIMKIKAELATTVFGDHAMLFQLVQCGKEKSVNEWFDNLDSSVEKDPLTGKPKLDSRTGEPVYPNKGIGDIVDCVSDYEIELAQILAKNPGCDWFDVPYYRVKCRVGVAIKALDQADETSVSKPVTAMGTVFRKMGFT